MYFLNDMGGLYKMRKGLSFATVSQDIILHHQEPTFNAARLYVKVFIYHISNICAYIYIYHYCGFKHPYLGGVFFDLPARWLLQLGLNVDVFTPQSEANYFPSLREWPCRIGNRVDGQQEASRAMQAILFIAGT